MPLPLLAAAGAFLLRTAVGGALTYLIGLGVEKASEFFNVQEKRQKSSAEEEKGYRRINDQAVLINNIPEIKNRISQFKKINLNNRAKLKYITNSSQYAINKIYNFKQFIEAYSVLSSADASFLNPYIKISKFYDGSGGFQFYFNNFFPLSDINNITSSERGRQANIVSVDFTSQGKDTATAFQYEVKIKFIFDSVSVLFDEKYKYYQLFNPPKKFADKNMTRAYNESYYKIILEFGWDSSPNLRGSNIRISELNKFIRNSQSSVTLNYIMHSLNINEDGTVNLNIDYIASIEQQSRFSEKLNILNDEMTKRVSDRAEKIQKFKENLQNTKKVSVQEITDNDGRVTEVVLLDANNEQVTDVHRDDAKNLLSLISLNQIEQQTGKEQFMNEIVKNIALQYNNRLPTISINKSVYDEAIKIMTSDRSAASKTKEQTDKEVERVVDNMIKGVEHNLPGTGQEYQGAAPQNINEIYDQQTLVEGKDGNKIVRYIINYWTFGALLNAIAALDSKFLIIGTESVFANFGNVAIPGPISEKDISANPGASIKIDNKTKINGKKTVLGKNERNIVNIFDIPIASTTYRYWYNTHVTAQNLTSMTLNTFLNLCVNELLKLAVQPENYDFIPKQDLTFKFLIDEKIVSKSILSGGERIDINNINLGSNAVQTSDGEKNNIIIFYSEPRFFSRAHSGAKNDIDSGIPIFYYGNEKGIVKKISFREETIPFFKEANVQTQMDKKASNYVQSQFYRGKYNVLMEVLGTANFKPGTLIYISPTFTGSTSSEVLKYGIGGYYVIITIKHSIKLGDFITIIEAFWVGDGLGGGYTDGTFPKIDLGNNAQR